MIIFTILGIISVVFQLVIFREFTFSIAKNELSFVLAAGMWLAFCSLGSILGRKKRFISPAWMGPSSALVFCLALLLIHLSKEWVGLTYYEAASLVFVFASAAIFVGMVSFCIGYLFAAFTNEYLKRGGLGEDVHAKFFAWEAAGFFIGGVIFSFWLSSYINPFVFAFLPLLLTLGLLLHKKTKLLSVAGIIVIGALFSVSFSAILTKEFKGANIEKLLRSHYGPIFVTDIDGVESLYVNGSLTSSSEDASWNETFIHTSIAAVSDISDVLYIGTYFSGQVQEILKYPGVKLDCLQIDPALSELSKRKIPKELRQGVDFIVDDPRVYIAKSRKSYDLIIMNIPAPSSIALNRYFTLEFFDLLSQRLKERGALSFFIPSKRDILSPQILKFDSCIVNTVRDVFNSTFLIPGDSMLILAGRNTDFSPNKFMQMFNSRAVKRDYFTAYHLKDYLDESRIAYARSMIDRKININRDLSAWGFLYYLLLEQRKFYPDLTLDVLDASRNIVVIGIILVIAISLVSLARRKISNLLSVSTLGSLSIGITAVIFLLFQLYSGALFWKMGVLIGLFMVGISAGTFFINRLLLNRSAGSRIAALLFFIWSLFGVSLFLGMHFGGPVFQQDLVFYLYAFLAGVFTGAGYPVFTRFLLKQAPSENVAVSVYAADLAGAFFGTLAFSIFLIPFLGISGAILAVIFVASAFSIKNIFG